MQQSLGLKGEHVVGIEQLILEQAETKYQEKLRDAEQFEQAKQAYKKSLTALIERGCYPFAEEIRKELKEFQDENNLTDEEIEEISQPILEAAEVEYQEKLRQRYAQEFKRVIEAGYPIDEVARSELKKLQQSLGLSTAVRTSSRENSGASSLKC